MYAQNKLSHNLIGIILCCLCFSCKKAPFIKAEPAAFPESKQVMDSIYLYAQQIYLWNTQLPVSGAIHPDQYTGSEINAYQQAIFDISRFAINPGTGKSFEYNPDLPSKAKFSVLIGKESGTDNQPALTDIGFNYGVTFIASDKNEIYISYVIKNSPAEISGLKRGMKLESVNDIKSETTTVFYNQLKTAFNSNNLSIRMRNSPDGTVNDYALRRRTYQPDPVNYADVLHINGHHIAYLSYLNFSSPDGRDQSIKDAFSTFSESGATDLIVDLRYNGGGDISSCESFANLIVPPAADGHIMRKEKYNLQMQEGKARILSNQIILDAQGKPAFFINGRPATLADGDYSLENNIELFHKTSGLTNLTRVYFIVSNKTASASELLINCLKPYLDVKLIGLRNTGQTGPVKTFGKPVGFFPVKIKSYQLYLSLFQNLNANNQGDYYDGITADLESTDDVHKDFGNLADPAIQTVLQDMGVTNVSNRKTILSKNQKPQTERNPFIPVELNAHYHPQELIKSRFKFKRHTP